MVRKFKIELEDELFHQLNELWKGDENDIQAYIVHILKESLNKVSIRISSKEKDKLENYLSKGQPGSRNYGVKGQGWWVRIKLFIQNFENIFEI